jgi:WD40 repeat protein
MTSKLASNANSIGDISDVFQSGYYTHPRLLRIGVHIYPYTLRHPGSVNAIAFSPDGKTVATASDNNTARLWGAATSSEGRVFNGHSDSPTIW